MARLFWRAVGSLTKKRRSVPKAVALTSRDSACCRSQLLAVGKNGDGCALSLSPRGRCPNHRPLLPRRFILLAWKWAYGGEHDTPSSSRDSPPGCRRPRQASRGQCATREKPPQACNSRARQHTAKGFSTRTNPNTVTVQLSRLQKLGGVKLATIARKTEWRQTLADMPSVSPTRSGNTAGAGAAQRCAVDGAAAAF